MALSRLYLTNFSRFILIIFIFVSICHIVIKYGNIVLQQADAKAPPAPPAPPALPQGIILGTITSLAFFGKSLNTHALGIPVLPPGSLSEGTIDSEIQSKNYVDQQIRGGGGGEQEEQQHITERMEEPKIEMGR
jgi:uncharacterized SAM-binding protein YcdF (DUF218 family)